MADRYVTVFRSRLRNDMDAAGRHAYDRDAARMHELASAYPGFVELKTFQAEDGERATVVEFSDHEDHLAWRRNEEHMAAQQRGRDRYYQCYAITVAKVVRQYEWEFATADPE